MKTFYAWAVAREGVMKASTGIIIAGALIAAAIAAPTVLHERRVAEAEARDAAVRAQQESAALLRDRILLCSLDDMDNDTTGRILGDISRNDPIRFERLLRLRHAEAADEWKC